MARRFFVAGVLLALGLLAVSTASESLRAEYALATGYVPPLEAVPVWLREAGAEDAVLTAYHAAAVDPTGRRYRQLSIRLIEQARRIPEGAGRDRLHAAANEAIRRALALAPAHPNTWFLAAFLELRAGERRYDRICRAWRQSVLLGPYEKYLIARRLRLGLVIEPRCGAVVTALFAEQIRWMWRRQSGALIDMAREHPALYAHVLRGLSGDPESIAAFVRRYNA